VRKIKNAIFTISALITALLAAFAVISANTAGAELGLNNFDLSAGSIVIGADPEVPENVIVTQGDQSVSIPASSPLTITTSEVTRNTLTFVDNVQMNVTLRDVKIINSYFLKSPICLDNGEDIILNVEGTNYIEASEYMAGIQVGKLATLDIRGNGIMTVIGGKYAAGIGGGWKSKTVGTDCGDVTVSGRVMICVYGGAEGAGIGGGSDGSSRRIKICDSSTVYATAGEGAAGIGGGKNGTAKYPIEICGYSTVEAKGSAGSAAIGGGVGGDVKSVLIYGNATVRAEGGSGAAAIGSGTKRKTDVISIYGNAKVRARGGDNAAAIGGSSGATVNTISVSDSASVYAVGGKNGAGIGLGSLGSCRSLTISQNAYVEVYGGDNAAGMGTGPSGIFDNVKITDRATVKAFGGINSPAIGNTGGATLNKIAVSSNAVVYALGGKAGAGIGAGSECMTMPEITVSGNAIVRSQGGNYGAGIGYGGKFMADVFLADGKIFIKDNASVEALGGKYAAGIGGGKYAGGVTVEVSGKAVVSAGADNEIAVTVLETTEMKVKISEVVTELGIRWPKAEDFAQSQPEIIDDQDQNGEGEGGENEGTGEEDTGDNGETGETGETGESGENGETGETGDNGADSSDEITVISVIYGHSEYGYDEIRPVTPIEAQYPAPEGSIIAPIYHIFDYSKINYASADVLDESEMKRIPAKDVGAGAGCLFQGSCIIKGDAKVNDQIGQVSLMLVYGIGGFENQISYMKKGESVTLPMPDKEGYVFEGWYDKPNEGTRVTGAQKIETDTVFYAKWQIIGVAISAYTPEDAFVGKEFSQTVFVASGGAAPYTFKLSDGKIPSGLTLDTSSGSISGVPKKDGVYSFTVTVTDGNGSVNSSYCTMKVYGDITYRFALHTSEDDSADTADDVYMWFDYVDRFTGEAKKSERINIAELLRKKYEKALAVGSVCETDITFPPSVGAPTRIYFENYGEDGWKCSGVTVSFPGSSLIETFSKDFPIDSWVGARDDGGMKFADVALLIIIIIIVTILLIVIVVIITRIDRKKRSKKSKQAAKGAAKGAASGKK